MNKKIDQGLIVISCAISLYFSGLFLPSLSIAYSVDLTFKGETLSANLKEVPLKTVLEKISREKGVWIKGNDSVLEEKVSIEFRELSLTDGLKRIRAPMNYSLVFDLERNLVGVIIIGKEKPGYAMAKGRAVPTRKPFSSQSRKEQVNTNWPFKVIGNISPLGSPVKPTAEELESLKVIKNCPPPGGPIKVSPEEFESLRVIKNCSPPGGPVKASAEGLESLMVVKSSPPAEDSPVKITKRTFRTINSKVKRNRSHRWR